MSKNIIIAPLFSLLISQSLAKKSQRLTKQGLIGSILM